MDQNFAVTQQRITICKTSGPNGTACEHKRGRWCGACGCLYRVKARGLDQLCPANKWPIIDQQIEST